MTADRILTAEVVRLAQMLIKAEKDDLTDVDPYVP